MCRLFAFRSIIQSQVHQSLIEADNALIDQSNKHPDGWGVAYYAAGAPHIIKSDKSAFEDTLFTKISGVVSSETLIAHIRQATEGKTNVLNTHPFQHGNWTFAHNGNIKEFAKYKDKITERICPALRRYILGETDSELIFFYILTHILERVPLTKHDIPIHKMAKSVGEAVNSLIEIIGPYHENSKGPSTETYLSFVITNGSTLLAYQGGKDIFYSSYKSSCKDKDICPSYTIECENPSESGYVNHLLFTSEEIKGQQVWTKLEPGHVIGVDWQMKLFIEKVT